MKDLSFTCIKSDGTPASVSIINSADWNNFIVYIKILTPGKYTVIANKMDNFYIQVNAGKPVAENSFCYIKGKTQMDMWDTTVYYCSLNDKNKNQVLISVAESIYQIIFKCVVTRKYNSASTQTLIQTYINAEDTSYMYNI